MPMVHFLDVLEDLLQFQELQDFTIAVISNIGRRHPSHSKSLSAAKKVDLLCSLTG